MKRGTSSPIVRPSNANERDKIDLKARTHASHHSTRVKGPNLTEKFTAPVNMATVTQKHNKNLPSHNNQQRLWRRIQE